MSTPAPARAWHSLLVIPAVLGLLAAAVAGAWYWLHPLNASPWDATWGWAVTATMAVIAVGAVVRRGRPAILVLVPGSVIAAATMVMLAGRVGPALVTVWLLLLGLGLGDLLLCALTRCEGLGGGERATLAWGLGLGALSLGVLGIGLCGWLRPTVLVPAGLLLSGVVLRHARARGAFRLPAVCLARAVEWWRSRTTPLSVLGLGVLAVCLAGSFSWALAPSVWYDEVNYQAAAPATYAREGRVIDIPEEFRTIWAHNTNMLFTFGATVAGVPAIKLVAFAMGLLALVATWSLGARLASRRVGALATLLVASMPVVSWVLGAALVDLAVTFYVVAAAIAALRAVAEPTWRWPAVAGLLAGLAVGTKLSAAVFVLVLGVALVGAAARRHGWRPALAASGAFGLAGLLAILPWLVRDWAWTGNPVFPFLSSVFPSPRWVGDASFNFESYGQRTGAMSFLLLPWDLLAHGEAFGPGMGPGVAGVLPWLGLPWLAPAMEPSRRRLAWALWGWAAVAIAAAMAVAQYLRYLLPAFPFLAVVAALNLETGWAVVSRRRSRVAAVLAGAVALVYTGGSRLAHTALQWELPERFPVRTCLGREADRGMLARALREYDAFAYLDARLPVGSKVLTVGCPLRMYTHCRVFEALHLPIAVRDLERRGIGSQELVSALVSRGFAWLVIDTLDPPGALIFPEALRSPELLSSHGTLVFRRHDTEVYRLSATPLGVASIPPPNLLANPGLELLTPDGMPAAWARYGRPLLSQQGGRESAVAVSVDHDSGLTQVVPVRGDVLYTLAHWTRADRAGQTARLQVNWLDPGGRIIDATIQVVEARAEWAWNGVAASAPADAVLAIVYANAHDQGRVWIDDLCFVEGGDARACAQIPAVEPGAPRPHGPGTPVT
ncbi:MAG: ArnT family glycosyltransferase [Thermoanaerobaculaceae bacterium]